MSQNQQELNEKLFIAIEKENLEEVNQLISKGANVNFQQSDNWRIHGFVSS